MNQPLTLQRIDVRLTKHMLWKLMLVCNESAFNLPKDRPTFSHTHIHLNFVPLISLRLHAQWNQIAFLLAITWVAVFGNVDKQMFVWFVYCAKLWDKPKVFDVLSLFDVLIFASLFLMFILLLLLTEEPQKNFVVETQRRVQTSVWGLGKSRDKNARPKYWKKCGCYGINKYD